MRRCAAVLAMLRAAAIVPRTRWHPQAERHLARVTKLLGAAPDVAAAQSRDDPLLNFVFTYYGSDLGAAANLGRWCPPVGVAIEASQDDRDRLWRGIESSGAYDPRKLPKKRLAALERGRAALAATRKRPPIWHCYGLHEWAMLYRPDGAPQPHKHQSLPLRVDQATINRVVEADEIKCTHFDAFRFFAPEATDKNRHALTRQTQLDHEQPACVHANMDLLRYALRLAPFVDASLIGDALDVALQARDLDIRASPYLLAGAAPVAVWKSTSELGRLLRRQTFVNLNAIKLLQLRGRRRVDGVGRPKCDFHTGPWKWRPRRGARSTSDAKPRSTTPPHPLETACWRPTTTSSSHTRSCRTLSRRLNLLYRLGLLVLVTCSSFGMFRCIFFFFFRRNRRGILRDTQGLGRR